MKRFAVRITRVFAVAASAGILITAGMSHPAEADHQPLGPAGSAAFPATVVVEVTCLHPDGVDLASPARVTVPAGAVVEVWCGDRVEMTAGRCAIRRGPQVTPVPCARVPR